MTDSPWKPIRCSHHTTDMSVSVPGVHVCGEPGFQSQFAHGCLRGLWEESLVEEERT